MKKLFTITLLAIVFTVGIVFNGFAQQKPVSGGILREVAANGPMCLSYLPAMGPGDEIAVMPGVERMMEYNNADKQIHPLLAEKVDVDRINKKLTFHIRKGVKFHDGSDLTAEVAAFWYQLYKDAHRLQFGNTVSSIEVADTYTMVLHLTDFNNQFLDGLGWQPIYSKAAWDKAGGGDVEKSKAFARGNCIGTGPFMLKEYKVDDHITWVKNPNYWQKGKPYLDGITVRYVPDPVTASAMMQSKEADMWEGPPPKYQAELEKKGFIRQSGFGLPGIIYINNKSPDSKFRDKRVREAVEYALDKPAIAKALGYGYYTPLTMTAPPGEWGYDPNYPGRPYNPEKAKQLLAEAGYPNGLKIKMLILPTPDSQDAGTAFKQYLDAAGFQVDLDVADFGRFFSSIWVNGWQDLAVFLTGLDFNYLATFFRQFGPDPFANYASFQRPQELIDMARQAYHAYDEATQKEWAKKLVRLMADECLVVPTYLTPAAYIIQPYVHTTFDKEMMVARKTYDEWMDKH
ncbi:MAG: ABC transporter substrate-binding protein [Thermodesulfobacteriota bacterium]|jgi:peptide/nickel transport system substrate-binding protein